MSKENAYPVTFDITCHAPPLKKEDIPKGRGAAHAIFYAAIMQDAVGNREYAFDSINGGTGLAMSHEQVFHFWLALAEKLAEDMPDSGAKELCAEVAKIAEKTLDAAREALGEKADAN